MTRNSNLLLVPSLLLATSALLIGGCEQDGNTTAQTTAASSDASGSAAGESADTSTENADRPDAAADRAEARTERTADSTDVRALNPTRAKVDQDTTTPDPRVARSEQDADELRAARDLRSSRDTGDQSGPLSVSADPPSLDLGQIPLHEAKTGIVKLVNNGDEPVEVINCRSSCGCTTTECPKNQMIEPGESVDVEVRVNGGTRATKINKRVTFTFKGQRPLIVPVNAQSIEFITVEPSTLRPDQHPEGKVFLASVDDQPFKILRMNPEMITDFPEGPQSSYELTVDWDLWTRFNEPKRLTFYTDHPKARQALVVIRAPRVARNNDGALDRDNRNEPQRRPQPEELSPDLRVQSLINQKRTDDVLAMIESGQVDLDLRNGQGATLLIQAAESGNPDLVEALIDMGASLEDSDRAGRTPLMAAAKSASAPTVVALLDAGAKVDAKDINGNAALWWGAGFGGGQVVRKLIDAGADANQAGMLNFTPLIWASSVGVPDAVQALIDAGADLEARGAAQGATPLIHAARTGDINKVTLLLKAGADVKATTRGGKTALLMAASTGGSDVNVIRTLIEAGSDIEAVDESGRNALDWARTRTDPRSNEVIAYLESITPQEGDDNQNQD